MKEKEREQEKQEQQQRVIAFPLIKESQLYWASSVKAAVCVRVCVCVPRPQCAALLRLCSPKWTSFIALLLQLLWKLVALFTRTGQARPARLREYAVNYPRPVAPSPCLFQLLIAPTRSIVHCHALDPRRHVSILATFAFLSPRLAAVAIVSRSRCSGSEIMLNGLIYNVCFCCRGKRGRKGAGRREAARNPIAMQPERLSQYVARHGSVHVPQGVCVCV